ncbi:MAG: DNA-directed RNA polymerase subunit beta [candidate division WOR-3 bacterium]
MPKIPKRIGVQEESYPMPDLLTVQLESYRAFLQEDVDSEKRTDEGLHGLFKEVFPIEGLQGKYHMEYVSYTLGKPKMSEEEAIKKNLTYAVPLRLKLRLVQKDPKTGKPKGEVVEQSVYFADIPYMTERGTFIINGVERVVVSQLHRSPGVYYELEEKETQIYSALLVPYRGPWIRFHIDGTKVLSFTISKRKKLPITRLLKAMGYKTSEEILSLLLEPRVVQLSDIPEGNPELICAKDIVDKETGEVILEVMGALTPEAISELIKHKINEVPVYDLAEPEVEVMVSTLKQDRIKEPEKALSNIYRTLRYTPPKDIQEAVEFIRSFFFSPEKLYLGPVGRYKLNLRLRHEEMGFRPPTVMNLTQEDLLVILKRLMNFYRGAEEEDDVNDLANRRVRRVGEMLYEHFRTAFVRLSKAIKEKMLLGTEEVSPKKLVNPRLVTASILSFFTQDRLSQFLDQVNPLAELTHKRRLSALGKGGLTRETAGFDVRDVHPSHYGRLCPIETSEGQNIGLLMSLTNYAKVDEMGFIRTPLRRVIDGKVSEEVEYLAPHEEIEHAIAPGDIYLRNGEIAQPSILCRHNRNYVLVPREQIGYMDVSPRQVVSPSASLIPFLEHDDANRALMGCNMQRQAVPLLVPEPPLVGTGMEGKVARDSGCLVMAKRPGIVKEVDAKRIVIERERVTDVYELGENQRPIVAPGQELKRGDIIARPIKGQKGIITAKAPGVVREVSPERVLVQPRTARTPDVYELVKFQRSNQDTIIDQRPVVRPGQKVKKGDFIAESVSVADGELALGKNLLVAFIPWYGYNYEDAVVISERVVKEDILTSIHILEFEVEVRDTKLGPEEVTRDLPYVASEELLKNLDEYGVIRVGAEVKPDDILVGKVSPKGERDLTPEERLIYAIFSKRAKDVKDTSRRVPPGIHGVVVDVVVLTKMKEDPLSQKIIRERKAEAEERFKIARQDIIRQLREALADILAPEGEEGLKPSHSIKDNEGNIIWPRRKPFTRDFFWQYHPMRDVVWPDKRFVRTEAYEAFLKVFEDAKRKLLDLEEDLRIEMERLERGDELPPGVRQLIKVYIAEKRKFQVGDKIAGRHGNKGVCAKIVPEEDMPFFDDGTPVDLVLNPLGVPSRMNVGQILETMLGWAAVENTKRLRELVEEGNAEKTRAFLLGLYKLQHDKNLSRWLNAATDEEILEHARELAETGIRYTTPVFEGISIDEIKSQLRLAGLPEDSKVYLRDGRTGERFLEKAMVGYIYMMKLTHMVEDKIHARAIGPYSLITQQPVGGKSHFGGQRFGEMEVWALEAHGAAYSLQEMLTVKSDDIKGRNALYKSILRGGQDPPRPSLPASFGVLLKELKGLALDVQVLSEEEEAE